MTNARKFFLLSIGFTLLSGFYLCSWHTQTTDAQTRLTYPEIITALQTKLPNKSFKTKAQLINWLIIQIKTRKVDKPLTEDREDDLRQAGATNALIEAIRTYSPPLPTPTPTPRLTPTPMPSQNTNSSNETMTASQYNIRGIEFYNKGDYDRAIANYTKAIELSSNYSAAYYNRGLAYKRKEDYDRAIADYTKAIELTPNYADAYNNRGNAYYHKKDYDLAIADYTKAIQIDSNYADFYNNRGLSYEKQVDYDRAIADYRKALEINPNYQLAKTNLERVLKKKNQ